MKVGSGTSGGHSWIRSLATACVVLLVVLAQPLDASSAPATGGGAAELTCDGLQATIVGTDGADVLLGTSGDDVIVGQGGNDVVLAFGGRDRVCAGAGDDMVFGGDGDDAIFGGEGGDALFGDGGDDLVDRPVGRGAPWHPPSTDA